MTAVADLRRGRWGRTGRARVPGGLAAMVLLCSGALSTGCTAGAPPPALMTLTITSGPTDTTAGATGSDTTATRVTPTGTSARGTTGSGTIAAVPPGDSAAIRHAIDAINADAGGPVSVQRAVLAHLVSPALAAALRNCPPATTTLRFEPVYAGLRPTPAWSSPHGVPAGTVYALPVLIRIYTGDRITGTDLATLHLGVRGHEASITPLCVG
jgi:hypothetical protein